MTNNSSVEEGRGGFPAHVAGHGRRPTWVRIGHSGPFSVRPLIPREPKSRTRLGRSETCQLETSMPWCVGQLRCLKADLNISREPVHVLNSCPCDGGENVTK